MPSRKHVLPSTLLGNLSLGFALGSLFACGGAPSGLRDMERPSLSISSPALVGGTNLTLSLWNLVEVFHNQPCVALPNGVTATQDGAAMTRDSMGYRTSEPPACYYPLFHAQVPDSSEETTTFVVSDGTDPLTVTCEHLGTPTTAAFQEPSDGVLHPGQKVTLRVTPRAWGHPWIELYTPAPGSQLVTKTDQVTMGDGTASFTVPKVPAGSYQVLFLDGASAVCRPQGRLSVSALAPVSIFLPATVKTPSP